jgi:zinc-ribbon domain/Putative peptidoglycan binding domain
MKCPNCAVDNPDNNRFCGQCGAILDETTRRFREEVRELIKQELRDEESLAVRVADKAEERIWRWSKILGIGVGLAALGLAGFGFTSFESSKKQIENAAAIASQEIKKDADDTKQSMEQRGTATIHQIQKSGTETIAQMQKEGEATLIAANSVSLRVKASNTKMAEIEQQQSAQLNTLATIRNQSPDTPIGSISTDLFKSSNSSCTGTNQPWYCPNGTYTPALSRIVYPYKFGDVGSGVMELQDRLLKLGCYSGPSTGIFDDSTAKGVEAFVAANGMRLLPLATASGNAPSFFIDDASHGTVDRSLWVSIFSEDAKKCTTTSQS